MSTITQMATAKAVIVEALQGCPWDVEKTDRPSDTCVLLSHPDWPNNKSGTFGVTSINLKRGSTGKVLIRHGHPIGGPEARWLVANRANISLVLERARDYCRRWN